MSKIKMNNPIVEMNGDEMTRILWDWIKELLIEPYVELNSFYYDLGLKHRDDTDDKVTIDAAEAIKKYRVGIKCATITPNNQRLKEYDLKKLYKSPNGTIRAILDGTVFREPILPKNITPIIPAWTKPIVIARHAYGDMYKCVDFVVDKGDKVELVVKHGNKETRHIVKSFDNSGGIVMGMHNTDESIISYAKSCFEYALDRKMDLWFATKDTISKEYDGRFKDLFEQIYESDYKEKFEKLGIEYFYTLIDDAVARVMRSSGGFIWACKNYDGDVMSDMLATVYASLAMMTSVLVSPDGNYEYEAAHGTVTRHYYNHIKGEQTSTNPIATIFAWSGGLYKRGELDNNTELMAFATELERASLATIESGMITKDLASLVSNDKAQVKVLNSYEFIKAIADNIRI